MRMWMIDPAVLCRKHLLGEHVECHMFFGSLNKKIAITGYVKNNLMEPKRLKCRHDLLAQEMESRGYNHNSPYAEDEEYLEYLAEEELNA